MAGPARGFNPRLASSPFLSLDEKSAKGLLHALALIGEFYRKVVLGRTISFGMRCGNWQSCQKVDRGPVSRRWDGRGAGNGALNKKAAMRRESEPFEAKRGAAILDT